VRIGLANEDDFEKTKTGEIKGMKPGRHVEGWKTAMTDPVKWLYQYGQPAMEKAGIKDQQDQIAELRRMFPNSNAADLMSKMLTQKDTFANHAKLYEEAQGINAVDQNQKDPYQAASAFSTAVSNFAGVVSSPAVAKAGEALSSLASGISSFTQRVSEWQSKNPEAATAAGITAGGTLAAAGGLGTYGLAKNVLGFGGRGAAEAAGGGLLGTMMSLPVLGGLATGVGLNEAYRPKEGDVNAKWIETKKKLAEQHEAMMREQAGLSGPSLRDIVPDRISDMRAAMQPPPSWSVNRPQQQYPMVGRTGATAGVQAPDFVDAGSAGNTAGGVSGALSIPDAGGTGARVGSDYAAGLQEQLQQAISYAQQAAQEIRAALDFSSTPNISASGGASAPAPQRQSSLTHIDHGRASAANVSPLSG
jgi:hypothetical protein